MDNPDQPLLTISIISHGQLDLVKDFYKSLKEHEALDKLEIILTENLRSHYKQLEEFSTSGIITILNPKPLGFAENNNQAFRHSHREFFCIINPDVLLTQTIFPKLLSIIDSGKGDIVAPLVISSSGTIQDSFRPIPTPSEILKRRFRLQELMVDPLETKWILPDWIAGIFLCMRSDTFRSLGGFNEKYRLYFEDVEFGTRARIQGFKLLVDTSTRIVHDARRQSHSNLYFLFHHFVSGVRFFTSKTYRIAKSKSKDWQAG